MCRPYEELTDEQKAERDHAWELLDSLSGELKFIAEDVKKNLSRR